MTSLDALIRAQQQHWPASRHHSMIEALEIAVGTGQGIVKDLSGLAEIYPDRLGFLPVHQADVHWHQIGLPSRKEAPRSASVVINEVTMGHVPVVVEGQITVGHEHVIAGEPAPRMPRELPIFTMRALAAMCRHCRHMAPDPLAV